MTAMVPCIILAGGLGTRLREAVHDRPKCLAPIGNRSFLHLQLELLMRQGINDFVLSLGYMADMVLDEVTRLNLPCRIRSVVEAQPLGTGGALLRAMEICQISEALATNGDTFLGGSLAAMLDPLHMNDGELTRMAVIQVPDRSRFGGVSLLDMQITGFTEKEQMGAGAINAGMYRLHRDAFGVQKLEDAFSFESKVLPVLCIKNALRAAMIDGEFTDIGVPDDYHRFCQAHG